MSWGLELWKQLEKIETGESDSEEIDEASEGDNYRQVLMKTH